MLPRNAALKFLARGYWETRLPVWLLRLSFSTRPRVGPLGLPNFVLLLVIWSKPQHASSNMLIRLPACIWTSCCHSNWALAGSLNVLSAGFPLSVHSIAFVVRLTRYADHVLRSETRNVSLPVSWIALR